MTNLRNSLSYELHENEDDLGCLYIFFSTKLPSHVMLLSHLNSIFDYSNNYFDLAVRAHHFMVVDKQLRLLTLVWIFIYHKVSQFR